RLIYKDKSLAAAQVLLTDAFEKGEKKDGLEELVEEHNEAYCCMSELDYQKFIKIIKQLKPLGSLEESDPIGVIPTSGWVRWTELYSNAFIVRLAQQCTKQGFLEECGIARFTVFYWFTLQGEITNKYIKGAVVKDLGQPQYFINVNGTDVEVSEGDYNSLQKGQKVLIRTSLTNVLAKIISIET
ncbi:MAG: hypothetical protein AB1489_14945, partial [Acidobacteriota bacterium]